MKKDIGKKIKELRNSRGLTLKQLSEKADLSISFLSQVERGIASIAVTSLEKIADVFEVELSYFFTPPQKHDSLILRSYEQKVFSVEESRIYHRLGNDANEKVLEPLLISLLPNQTREEITPYSHEGEEFVYVLEGILTIFVGNQEYQLNPGDSVHMSSTIPHEWANFTNKLVKVLSVSTPRIFGRK
ncbi:MAG: cupin domain-containing protein [Thermoanaerobacteraceae bacterium]|nr:cupin domain-containing protein [Thermoanaerobacteraceae bacterium]HHY03601.1 cupin domain-containing protein [Thermoanaerobacterales bacterium]